MTNTERLSELDGVITALGEEIKLRASGGSGHSAHIDSFANLCEERRFYIAMAEELTRGQIVPVGTEVR